MASPKDLIAPGRLRVGVNPQTNATEWLKHQALFLHEDSANPSNLTTGQFTNNTLGATIRNYKGRGTVNVPLDIADGDNIWSLEGKTYSGGTYFDSAFIRSTVDGTFVSGQAPPSKLIFCTNIANGIPLSRVQITKDGTLVTLATSTTVAGLNVPHGTAPAAPNNGDVWTTSAGGLFARINGVTENYAPKASPTFTGTVNAAALTMTGQLIISATNALISTASTGSPNDTKAMTLSSCNDEDSARGAFVRVRGFNNGFGPTADLFAGAGSKARLFVGTALQLETDTSGATRMLASLATTAGGNANGIKFGSSSVTGIFFGSGAPTITAPKGALYLRTDGSSTITRAYINTDGGTTWTAIVTVA